MSLSFFARLEFPIGVKQDFDLSSKSSCMELVVLYSLL